MQPQIFFHRVDNHGFVVFRHEIGDASIQVVILQHLLYQIPVKNRPLAMTLNMRFQVFGQLAATLYPPAPAILEMVIAGLIGACAVPP